MAGSSQPMYNYFRDKFTTWKNVNGRMTSYVPVIGGKDKVLNELKQDAGELKVEVCPYIKEAGYIQSKNVLVQAAEGIADIWIQFPFTGTLDIVMGALLDLCGFYRRGNSLIEKGL